MRLEYIDPFVEGACSVLKETLDVPVEKGKLTLFSGLSPKQGIAVSFGLTGGVEGQILFDLSEEMALKIAGLMNDRKFDAMEPIVLDSIAELMNIIVGRSVTLLNEKGFNFYITPPTMYSGKDMKFWSVGIETLVVPVGTPYGDMVVNVALRTTV
ncbi:MAG: chemotaxis protein CheX [Thermodesulfobacteriota bacterium]